MNLIFRVGMALLLALSGIAPSVAQTLPTDIEVTLSASPSRNLVPGQVIHFTATATNHGPEPAAAIAVDSSWFNVEFDLSRLTTDCDLFVGVIDAYPTAYYYLDWNVAYYDEPNSPFPVGETRVCHFSMPITEYAPAALSFSMNLAYWVDVDPSNDESTMTLYRYDPLQVPTLSSWGLALFSVLCGAVGLLSMRAGPGLLGTRVHKASSEL